MPSHGTDILHLIPDSELDNFGMVTGETVKMTKNQIQQAARSAGLPFALKNINPLLASLQMLGFLEMEDDNGKKLYFKSALIKEPKTKIDWVQLLASTEKFMYETWPKDVADEYVTRFCRNVEVENPFTQEKVTLGTEYRPSVTEEEKEVDDYANWLE